MRYEHEAEAGGTRMRGAASRFDRWGTRRGTPYAADPAYDEPPLEPVPGALPWTGGAGGGAAWADGPDAPRAAAAGGEDAGSWVGGGSGGGAGGGGWDDGPADGPGDGWGDGFSVDAGYDAPLYGGALWGGPWLPPRAWYRWRRRPWFPRFHGMLRRARPVGTLRHRRTGARYPVYRGRMGGRSWRIVTRPTGGGRMGGGRGFGGGRGGGIRREIIAMEEETGVEGEAFPIGGGAPSAAAAAPPPVNGPWRLTLPHSSLHGILGRMRPEQLRAIGGGSIPLDPAAAVVRRVGWAARRARRLGRFRTRRGVSRLDVFAAPGMRLLVRPRGELEGEIVAVAPVQGEEEAEINTPFGTRRQRTITGVMTWYGPFRFVDLGPVALQSIPNGPALPNVDQRGIYLLEKRGNQGFRPAYVGQGDTTIARRVRERRDHLRQARVDLTRYRIYVGIPSPGTLQGTNLLALEHAVVRSVLRGVQPGASQRATDQPAAEGIPLTPLTNQTLRMPFQVLPAGLWLIHRAARGQNRPAYLRSGMGTSGQWYELEG